MLQQSASVWLKPVLHLAVRTWRMGSWVHDLVSSGPVMLARRAGRAVYGFDPVSQGDVGGNEVASGSDVTGPKVSGCLGFGESFGQPSSHRFDELVLELGCGARLQSSIGCSNQGLGLGVRKSSVGRSFSGAMNPHQGFEEVAICQRPSLRSERANVEGLLKGATDAGFVLSAYPVQHQARITRLECGPRCRDDRPLRGVAVSASGRRNPDASGKAEKSDGLV